MKRRRKPRRSFAVPRVWLTLAALETGVVAGLVTVLYLIVEGSMRGEGPWRFLNLVGAAFRPQAAFSDRFSMGTMSGLALYLLVAGAVGILFGLLLVRYVSRPIRSHWIGLLLGAIWFFVAFRYFWPHVNPAVAMYQPLPAAFLSHLVFGFCMGLYPRFVARLGMSRAPSRASPFL